MIQEISNFLPEDLARRFYQYGHGIAMGGVPQPPQSIWTNLNWHNSLTSNSSLVLCVRPPKDMEQEIEDFLVKEGILDFTQHKKITDTGMAINIWGRGSFITAHPDANYSKAVTVYLNEDWIYNHGGIFHWQSPETQSWYSITPSFNKAVINEGGLLHGITPVQSDFRITIQIFVHKA